MNQTDNIDDHRRRFLIRVAKSVGLAAVGGITWSGVVREVASSPLVLRPPGALAEEEFLAQCVKCGLCVEACPYDTLELSKPGDNNPLGTPFFTPREIPCYMCQDIPCVPVCPSGALNEASVSGEKDDQTVLDINEARMGVAVVDTKSCIAYWGIQCDACYRVCPLMDKAITLQYNRNERTGKHAILTPFINPDYCTGCGMCERACVTGKASIVILPLPVVQGDVDATYIKGWDKLDEQRLRDAPDNGTTKTDISSKSAIDYLNEDLLLDE